MEKLITGTITITYKVNCKVMDSFNDNEVEEYIKDNLDECVDWNENKIENIDFVEDTLYEQTDPEDNTYSGGIYE